MEVCKGNKKLHAKKKTHVKDGE